MSHEIVSHVVLSVGLDPSLFQAGTSTAPSPPPLDLDHDGILAAADVSYTRLRARGFDIVRCLVDQGETAEATYRKTLTDGAFDFIVIGAGIRLDPDLTELFEMLVNVGIELCPRARLVFDTGPATKADAVLRWSPRPRHTTAPMPPS